ncbi:Fc.00g091410.m01.CDS01 [Cosmosporella sp. VM-42]
MTAEHARDKNSSILFESQDKAIVVIDIPRSLEESQVLASQKPRRRIYSVPPSTTPFTTPEPKRQYGADDSTAHLSPATRLAELMATATVQGALHDLHKFYPGRPFYLPRLLRPEGPSLPGLPLIPDKAEALHGSIQALSETFDSSAPIFDLLVLDPPWPNRSARRKTKNKYATVSNLREMRSLLMHIPVASHLAPTGLVAVWITNKPSIQDFLTSPTGLFASWGLEIVTEWTWLKVTASGEPIVDIESRWRKPWEKLIIAQRIGGRRREGLEPKVLVAVPDLHSRKPSLRGIFQDVLGKEDYLGLEVFARNLTAGWWSWGDDVFHFQQQDHWAEVEET